MQKLSANTYWKCTLCQALPLRLLPTNHHSSNATSSMKDSEPLDKRNHLLLGVPRKKSYLALTSSCLVWKQIIFKSVSATSSFLRFRKLALLMSLSLRTFIPMTYTETTIPTLIIEDRGFWTFGSIVFSVFLSNSSSVLLLLSSSFPLLPSFNFFVGCLWHGTKYRPVLL